MPDLFLDQLEVLYKKLTEASHAYYVLNRPTMTDYEWDELYHRLKKWELDNPKLKPVPSPLDHIGGLDKTALSLHRHPRKLYSLDNALTLDALHVWLERLGDAKVVAEHKYDGLAISIIYKDGQLQVASTRGDGEVGERVTDNVSRIQDVPQTIPKGLPQSMELRGEVVLPIVHFNAARNEQIAVGVTPYCNPRNAAAGILRAQYNPMGRLAMLKFIPYEVHVDGKSMSQSEKLKLLRLLFPDLPQHAKFRANQLNAIDAFVETTTGQRSTLPYEVDGIVFKVDDSELVSSLGETTRAPRWAIAYKYPPIEVSSTLEAVSYQVSRSGTVTPVAHITPVIVGGVTVSRANLHNANVMAKLKCRIGAKLIVRRAGDVIPQITSIVQDDSHRPIVVFTNTCPECGTKLELGPTIATRVCPGGFKCLPQRQRALEHFFSRMGMNVNGLGPATLSTMLANQPDLTPAGVYSYNFPDSTLYRRIRRELERSKESSLARVIYALGIRQVGVSAAKKLAEHYRTLENLRKARISDLESIKDVGSTMARSIVNYFADELTGALVTNLMPILKTPTPEVNDGVCSGQVWVVTGTFRARTRKEWEQFIVDQGGSVASDVTRKTDFLLSGVAVSRKMNLAKERGVRIVNEQHMLQLTKMQEPIKQVE